MLSTNATIALVDTLQPSAQLLLKELSSAQVQMKPGAGRLQLDVPLPPMGPNVNADEVPMKQRKHLRLMSSPAELPTSFAVGARPRLPGVANVERRCCRARVMYRSQWLCCGSRPLTTQKSQWLQTRCVTGSCC